MENLKTKVLLSTLIITVIFSVTSCTNNKPDGSKAVAEDRNEAKFEDAEKRDDAQFRDNEKVDDAQFLVDAAAINREEISLGQLAQQKGNNGQVKELGRMMEIEHTKALAELTALAKSKNISLPTSQTDDGRDVFEELNDKTGEDFGKAYGDMMVDEHKEAIKLFEKASTDSADPDIRAWAIAALPSLRKHLNHSLEFQDENKNNPQISKINQ